MWGKYFVFRFEISTSELILKVAVLLWQQTSLTCDIHYARSQGSLFQERELQKQKGVGDERSPQAALVPRAPFVQENKFRLD
jgi:hypothetical protein